MARYYSTLSFFFFNDTATTEIYTLSLHDALPISYALLPSDSLGKPLIFRCAHKRPEPGTQVALTPHAEPLHSIGREKDRKSTRLNSSHLVISYAVFCLKKKKIYISSNYSKL